MRRSPSSLTGAGTATVRVKAATTAATGTYAITRKGTGGTVSHTATCTVTVQYALGAYT